MTEPTIQTELFDLIANRCRRILVAHLKFSSWEKAERYTHLKRSLDFVKLDGHYLEFGVAGAITTNIIAEKISPKTLYGFDSFEGLPENSGIPGGEWVKGAYRQAVIPQVKDNVTLVTGLFADTLPEFSKQIDTTAYLHIDCDLYSSTKTIFDTIGHTLKPGTIIVFDEFHAVDHEPKAFVEWLEKNNYYGIMLNRTGYYQQVTFVLTTAPNPDLIKKIYLL